MATIAAIVGIINMFFLVGITFWLFDMKGEIAVIFNNQYKKPSWLTNDDINRMKQSNQH